MKTIYLLQKNGRYSSTPKILRAFESLADAEDIKSLLEMAGVEGVEISELALEPTSTYSRDPAPKQPVYRGIGEGWISGGGVVGKPSLAELP